VDSKGTALRQQMNETRAGLTGKLEELGQQVSGTVRSVKHSVNTIRDSFDLKLQVRRHPWSFVAGAAVLGFWGGFRPKRRSADTARPEPALQHPVIEGPIERAPFPRAETTNASDGVRGPRAATPNWFANLNETFQPEIAELRGIVIGGLIELVREMLVKQAKRPIERDPVSSHNGRDGASAAEKSVPTYPSGLSSNIEE